MSRVRLGARRALQFTRWVALALLASVSMLFGAAPQATASHRGPSAPYLDPAYDAQLEQLLTAVWPNAYSDAEINLQNDTVGRSIRNGLMRSRMAAGVLPPLHNFTDFAGAFRLGATEPWFLQARVNRSRVSPPLSDSKWLRLTGPLGKVTTGPNYTGAGWKFRQGCETAGGDGTTTKYFPLGCDPDPPYETFYYVYFGVTNNAVEVTSWRSDCGSVGGSCGGFYDEMDRQARSLPIGTIEEVVGTDGQRCNSTIRGQYPGGQVRCWIAYVTNDQMNRLVYPDRFENYTNQPIELTLNFTLPGRGDLLAGGSGGRWLWERESVRVAGRSGELVDGQLPDACDRSVAAGDRAAVLAGADVQLV